ncbi:MAG: DUF924 family protein [Burkholderiaceae bacterium]|jgi:uncharacterized protein (DUF924 family)|nr:DUF924 family protein [Burkholderiaceae bacterium]
MALAAIEPVIDFWFGTPPVEQPRAEWFRKDAAFDEQIRARFGSLVEEALNGGLRACDATPHGALARIVLLDQFTRNLFRGTARAFAGDALALAAAQAMVARGDDRWLGGVMRTFVYLPFEHSEDAAMQAESLRLFARLTAEYPALADAEVWAKKHEVIIARFGRYPHRNEALGRVSTVEEVAFLKEAGSSF